MSLPYLVALTHFGKIGSVSYQRLVAQFGAIEHAWYASLEDLTLAIPQNLAREFVAWRTTADIKALHDDALRRGMQLVAIDDPAYPALLKTIHDPPYLLYVRGTLPPGNAVCVGVVGSRRASEYGLRVAKHLSQELARRVVIVSGLADGIDDAAHRSALEAHGSTIAIVAGGLDGQDRARKEMLADEIVGHGGAVVSEFSPEHPPMKHLFPIRNRIIAGMSKGVLVVEAAEKSGSLITARAAIAENREVFAVPGAIYSETSQGTNRLCKEGAHVATCAEDIFEVLGLPSAHPSTTRSERSSNGPPPFMGESEGARTTPNLDPTADALLAFLSAEPQHVDDIARAARLPAATVVSTLTMLEIEGHVRHLGGMRYIR